MTIYPEEDVYSLCLCVFQDLMRSDDEHLQLASCMALGNFVQMNYIHDLTVEQCKVLSNKVLLCSNSSCEGAEEAAEALLLFLLSDSRAKRPEKQFDMLLEPDLLRADVSGHFPLFTAIEASTLDFQQLFEMVQKHMEAVFESDKFKSASMAWETWHAPILEEQHAKKLEKLLQEEIHEVQEATRARLLFTQDSLDAKLFAPWEETKPPKKGQ